MGCIVSKDEPYRDRTSDSMKNALAELQSDQSKRSPSSIKTGNSKHKQTNQGFQDESKKVQNLPKPRLFSDNDEKLLVESEDRRIQACISCRNTFPLNCIGKIIIHLTKNNVDGSGFLISKNLILTSAHNLFAWNKGEWTIVPLNSAKFYVGFNGMSPNRYQLTNDCFVSPAYVQILEKINKINVQIEQIEASSQGEQAKKKRIAELTAEQDKLKQETQQHDFALIRLKTEVDLPEYLSLDTAEPIVGSDATVSGGNQMIGSNFPLLSHTGPLQVVNKRVIFYNIDTDKGQSGSPVLVTNGKKARVIGIHKGYHTGMLFNLATRITPELVEQIETYASKIGIDYKNEPVDNLRNSSNFRIKTQQRINELSQLLIKSQEKLKREISLNDQLKRDLIKFQGQLLAEKRRNQQENQKRKNMQETAVKIRTHAKEVETTQEQVDKIQKWNGDALQMAKIIENCKIRLQKLQITKERLSRQQATIIKGLKEQLQKKQEESALLSQAKEKMKTIAKKIESGIKRMKSWQEWDATTPFAHMFNIEPKTVVRSANFDESRYQVVSLPVPPKSTHSVSFKIRYGKDGGIMVGLITGARRDKQYSYGGDNQVLSYCTSPRYEGEKKGWIEMDKKTIVNASPDLFIPDGKQLQIEINMDSQIVTFVNSTNSRKDQIELAKCFKGKQLYLFATMRERGDFVEFV